MTLRALDPAGDVIGDQHGIVAEDADATHARGALRLAGHDPFRGAHDAAADLGRTAATAPSSAFSTTTSRARSAVASPYQRPPIAATTTSPIAGRDRRQDRLELGVGGRHDLAPGVRRLAALHDARVRDPREVGRRRHHDRVEQAVGAARPASSCPCRVAPFATTAPSRGRASRAGRREDRRAGRPCLPASRHSGDAVGACTRPRCAGADDRLGRSSARRATSRRTPRACGPARRGSRPSRSATPTRPALSPRARRRATPARRSRCRTSSAPR